MAANTIATLKPGAEDQPLEIKVIRKWTSFGIKELCFIFVDKHANAIQATADLRDRAYFDALLNVGRCYHVTNYICEAIRTSMKNVPHESAIRLGKAARFCEIASDDFPTYYFNFVQHNELESRANNHAILTDYIGRVEHVTDVVTQKGINITKFKLEDLSGAIIEASFFDDAATPIKRQAIASLSPPVTIAVTSMRVTKFRDALQLNSTSASYIYINPDVEEARVLTAEFLSKANITPALKIQYEKSTNADLERQRNRFTIAQLLSLGVQFTCKGVVVDFNNNRPWFYISCDQCYKKLLPRGTIVVCEDHDHVIRPRHLYCFSANIKDHTAEAKTTFFDAAGRMFVDAECITLVTDMGYTDPHILPPPLIALRGDTRIFQLRFSKSSKPGFIDFIADNVFRETLAPTSSLSPPTPDSHMRHLKRSRESSPPKTSLHAPDSEGNKKRSFDKRPVP